MTRSVLAADGVLLRVAHLPPAVPSGQAVVIAHGFASSKDDPTTLALARALSTDGHDVYTYDARGHGMSGGVCTLGDLERLDVAAVAELATRDADALVLVGASMGAVAVLAHGADGPDVAGVVSVSSPATWRLPLTARGLAATLLTRTPAGRRLLRRRLGVEVAPRWSYPDPPVRLIARLRAPVALVHGRADRMLRARVAVELYAAARSRCRLDLVDGMGHGFDAVSISPVRNAVAWALGPDRAPQPAEATNLAPKPAL